MKYSILFLLLAIPSVSHAMEFRIGPATFNWQLDMGFMQSDFDINATVFSISEQHNNFADSKFYYFYNADIYQSDYVDKITTLVTRPITQDYPGFGSVNDAVADNSSIPVPADYKIRGFDLNLGLGYDLFRNKKGLVGVGINTGISLPVMKMKNMDQAISTTYKLLETTETSITTYKLGPILHAQYEIIPKVLMYGTLSAGLQTGSIENDYVKSSLDVDGSYTFLDLGVRFTPWEKTADLGWIQLSPKLYFTVGYSYKKWDMDDITVDTYDIATFSSGGLFSNSFDTNYFYLGLGFDF